MTIEIERKTNWADVLNAARFTVGKEPLNKEPSDKFKESIIRAEHSPLRELVFTIRLYGIPKYVSVHLCRHHEGVEKFVSTSRPDRKAGSNRHENRDDDLVNMQLTINAQALINISKVRLCNLAEKQTREIWAEIVRKLEEIEPILEHYCVPSCVYRGFCPEIKSCRFADSMVFRQIRNDYKRKHLPE